MPPWRRDNRLKEDRLGWGRVFFLFFFFLFFFLIAGVVFHQVQSRRRVRERTAAVTEGSSRVAELAVLGLLLERGITSNDLSRKEEGGMASLMATVNGEFNKEAFRNELQKILSSLGFDLSVSPAAGTGVPGFFQLSGPNGRHTLRILFLEKKTLREKPAARAPAPPIVPMVAIVIDDLGLSKDLAEIVVNLPVPVTVSVMPQQPFSTEVAKFAAINGKEVLMHLPMEPLDFPEKNPGPGALMADMGYEETVRTLRQDLSTVPGAVGVNNHMGSRLTADTRAMEQFLNWLALNHLVFLDSRTSPGSVAYQTARDLGLKTARRDIFLDDVDDPSRIKEKLDELIVLALRQGEAVGIGHPRENTLMVLAQNLNRFREAGVRIVPLSRLAR